ncbi:uncharacterized protein At1g43920, Chloroplastic-like [Nicotiana sylvestris]|uniref:Uncharacterized protein LOC104241291 n=1 Tax=Nicotiana sylvestris TaxID=4096 RepID=A0A1U7XY35_NICSY|nr:PREDICTED: uncharacterized protein LOC104241291 [Nicotiana sylvestris]
MSQGSSSTLVSSQIKCHCGLIVSQLTSKTIANPGRKFYKCLKPKDYSCRFFLWEDEVFPVNPMNANRELGSSIDVVMLDIEKLKQEVAVMEAKNHSQVIKVSILEEKVSKTWIILLIILGLYLGFIAASMKK